MHLQEVYRCSRGEACRSPSNCKGETNILIYLAAPYSLGDPVANCSAAIEAWNQLREAGYTALVPHTSMMLDLVHPQLPKYWYDYTEELMLHCDLVLRLPGESVGADEEVRVARMEGIEVFEGTVEQFLDSEDMCKVSKPRHFTADECDSAQQRPPIGYEDTSKCETDSGDYVQKRGW